MPLEAASLHEMGHVIGPEDACSPKAPMCTQNEKRWIVSAPAKLTSLTSKDLENVCALHPRSAVLTVQASLSKLPLDDALFAAAFADGGLWI